MLAVLFLNNLDHVLIGLKRTNEKNQLIVIEVDCVMK